MAKPANTTVSEALGVLLLASGVLLLLALVSYDPADVPSWVFFSHIVPPSPKISNFIGIVGVLVAGLLYFLIGAAAYLLAVVLLGFGAGKMFFPKVRFADRIGWVVLFILCGASLLQIQPWFLHAWRKVFHIEGPGGWFGLWIGGKAFENALGPVGSAIVLVGLYVASLILVTGFHPIRFTKMCVSGVSGWFAARRERRRAALDQEALFAENQREIEKGARKLEKKIRRRAEPEPEPAAAPAEPAPILPAPKIIDASVPAPPRKPTLEEVNSRRKKVDAAALIPGLKGVHVENYELPSLDLIDSPSPGDHVATDPAELKATQDVILDTLAQFSIQASPGDITKGPTITRYELYPAKGVRVDRISSLERDIARATRAERINILAPIPGKDTVGIEIANAKKVKVTLRELFESDAWVNSKARLPLALGKDVYGNAIIADLAQMPHCLVAGTTGSGKSVCINAIIASLLFRFTPEELRFIMIDPKVVEMQLYNTLPHLVTPVVTEPKKVLLALRWVVDEMETRYRIIAKCGVRNIAAFNARPKPKTQAELDAEAEAAADSGENAPPSPDDDGPVEIDTSLPAAPHPEAPDMDVVEAVNEPEPPKMSVPRDADQLTIPDHMPYIVVIIDELADLMQTAPAEVEEAVARIAQKARAAGIHLIVATQTPRADVVTGIIKANIPSRIAFQVASKLDSRIILDESGAEKLLGQGDMLYLPPGTSKLVRSQGVLVTDDEIRRVVEAVSANAEPQFEPTIHAKLSSNTPPEEEISDEDEELVEKCLEIIKQEGKASTSMLQRRLRLGYTRAARVVDILEQRGILGPKDGAKDREILVDLNSFS